MKRWLATGRRVSISTFKRVQYSTRVNPVKDLRELGRLKRVKTVDSFSETALAEPVKRYFIRRGFEVRSEVAGRDLVAVRDDFVVVIELKRSFTLDLVLQGIDRQASADFVCLAVPAPKRRGRRWTRIRSLCQRLQLGLLAVTLPVKGEPSVELVCEPSSARSGKRQSKERTRLLAEFAGRSGDYNVGGSTGRPLVTRYREEALRLAQCLKSAGDVLGVKELRQRTGCERAGNIVRDNYYGWFERVERGVYRLTTAGEEALTVYADVVRGWDTGR